MILCAIPYRKPDMHDLFKNVTIYDIAKLLATAAIGVGASLAVFVDVRKAFVNLWGLLTSKSKKKKPALSEADEVTYKSGKVGVRFRDSFTEPFAALTQNPFAVARGRIISRLEEVKASRSEQLGTEKWLNRSAVLLTVGQYIIGGILASSFVQESLSPNGSAPLAFLFL